jgi:hypothetical protein
MDWHRVQNFGPQMKNLSGVIRNLAPHARQKIRVRGRRSLSGSLMRLADAPPASFDVVAFGAR